MLGVKSWNTKRTTITGYGQVAIFQRCLHGVVGFEAETYPGFHAVQPRRNSEKNRSWSGMLLRSSVQPSVLFAVKAPGPLRVLRNSLAAVTLTWLAWSLLTLCLLAALLSWLLDDGSMSYKKLDLALMWFSGLSTSLFPLSIINSPF